MTEPRNRSTATFDRMAERPDWLGFGYLGERNTADAEVVASVDRQVLSWTREWTYEELFDWANSKLGRWFGEELLHGGDWDTAIRMGLLSKIEVVV